MWLPMFSTAQSNTYKNIRDVRPERITQFLGSQLGGNLVINSAVDCHCIPPSPRLPFQPGQYQRYTGVNNLPKMVNTNLLQHTNLLLLLRLLVSNWLISHTCQKPRPLVEHSVTTRALCYSQDAIPVNQFTVFRHSAV